MYDIISYVSGVEFCLGYTYMHIHTGTTYINIYDNF